MNDITSFTKESKQGKDRLFAIFHFLQNFFEQTDFNGCWCLNTVAEIPVKNHRILEEIQKQKKEFIGFIAKLVSENCDQDSDPKNQILAQKIYLLYESSLAESKVHQDSWPIVAGLSMCEHILS